MLTRIPAAALTAVVLLILATANGISHHEDRVDERIVQPFGLQVVTHIPVVAGYEPFPLPVHCLPGSAQGDAVVYEEDFESADPGWTLSTTPLAGTAPNLWHVTDFEGYGEELPGKRLYFGQSSGPAAGMYGIEEEHMAGSAQSPPITLPAEGAPVLEFTTKWHTEYLKGYDHMWVELTDEAGQVHLLCSNNGAGRADPAGVGGNSAYSSCSPFLLNPCPVIDPWTPEELPGLDDLPDPGLGYPAWETRHVELPQSLAGQTVRIQLTFDTADGAANHFLGWMVHDVKVKSS